VREKMSLLQSALILMTCTFASMPGVVSATESTDSQSYSAEQVFRYALHLEQEGAPRAAAWEYRRALWLHGAGQDDLSVGAAEGFVRCLVATDGAQDALRWAEIGSPSSWPPCLRGGLDVELSRAELKLGAPDLATTRLTRLAQMDCSSAKALQPRVQYLLGIASAKQSQWAEASNHFKAVPDSSVFGSEASRNQTIAEKMADFPRRSPAAAAWLGIVPGAGYYYSGFKQSALSALIVNLVFAQATREAFRRDQDTLGWFMGAFSVSWYAGSIFGSAESARRYNAFHEARAFDQMSY
jgi:hypothetical protein